MRIPSRRPGIYVGAARQAVIERVASLLNTAPMSKFQYEGSCRHGLRSAMVLGGHSWAASDMEAASIVSAGLAQIGAARPTWWQGQPESTYGPDRCLWCFGPLDGDDVAAKRRFCSPVCAGAAKVYREYRDEQETRQIADHAFYIARRDDAPERRCEHCGQPYRRHGEQRYCSKACASLARRHNELDKICANPACNRPFRAQRPEIMACSISCAAAVHKLTSPPKTCEECREPFHGVHNAKFCSIKCRSRAANRASYAKRKERG